MTAGKGLRAGTVSLAGSVVIAVSSVAPAYSLAAVIGGMVAVVGAKTPALFVIGFLPMMLTAFAFRELASETPDCGSAFTWATRAFGPWVGWLAGWASVIAATVAVGNGAQVAAIYLLEGTAPERIGKFDGRSGGGGRVGRRRLAAAVSAANRGHRAHTGRAGGGAVRDAGAGQRCRVGEGLRPSRGSPGGDAAVELAVSGRTIRRGRCPRGHPVRLRVLGVGCVPGDIRGDQAAAYRTRARPPCSQRS